MDQGTVEAKVRTGIGTLNDIEDGISAGVDVAVVSIEDSLFRHALTGFNWKGKS
jgi:hypothetical protein